VKSLNLVLVYGSNYSAVAMAEGGRDRTNDRSSNPWWNAPEGILYSQETFKLEHL